VVKHRNQTLVAAARALPKQRGMPTVSYLRIFGCLAFVKELNYVGKLDDRSSPGVFIGYAEGAKAYRMLNLAT